MKKYMVLTVVLAVLCSMFACVPASAESGVVGHIYSTDILTYVNGQPIDGYNIGGRTVVIAEDLDSYGFNHGQNINLFGRNISITVFIYSTHQSTTSCSYNQFWIRNSFINLL